MRQAGNVFERPPQTNTNHLERGHFEIIMDVCHAIQSTSLSQFTFSWIDSLHGDLSAVVHHLDRLPEVPFKRFIEVIDGLREARNELRLARFLFDVEEINPVHRLVMRNRAILRGEYILIKVMPVWPMKGEAHDS